YGEAGTGSEGSGEGRQVTPERVDKRRRRFAPLNLRRRRYLTSSMHYGHFLSLIPYFFLNVSRSALIAVLFSSSMRPLTRNGGRGSCFFGSGFVVGGRGGAAGQARSLAKT